jgi:hypothetical protein
MGNRAERHESETESNGLVERERVRERERERGSIGMSEMVVSET